MKALRFLTLTWLTMGLVCFANSSGAGIALADDWPQWRGPNRDGLSTESGLLAEWPEGGPAVVWKIHGMGEGYSTVSIVDGRIHTMGNVDGEGRSLCLEEATGQTLWSIKPPTEQARFTHQKGNGARGTPTVDGGRVYALGGGGDLTCVDAATGNVLWASHLVKDLGGQRPGWGFSESPLVDGDRLLVTPGGNDGTVAVLDKLTGSLIWRSKGVVDKAHYSSAILADVDGVRQVIQFTGGTGSKRSDDRTPSRVIGLDAGTGELLWDYDKPGNATASVCTPIYHDGHVFASSAYGTGGGLVRLTRTGSKFSAEEVYFERSMANHHGGIVLVDGFLYGFGSNSLICLNFKTGEIAWQNRCVSKGSVCYADGHLYCHGEKNQVALVEANPKAYVEKGRFDLERFEHPTWTHPVVCNGRLYLRDMDVLTCYDVRSQTSKN